MKVTRKSKLSGKEHVMDLPVTQEQLDRYATGNFLVQDVFPNLDADQREFLITGITPEEWDATFSGGEE